MIKSTLFFKDKDTIIDLSINRIYEKWYKNRGKYVKRMVE